jgi:hypothetical protein
MKSLAISSLVITALAQIPTNIPTTLPTISADCQKFYTDQAKALETPCGIKESDVNSVSTMDFNAILNSANQSLTKVCSTQCEAALKTTAAAIKAKSECLTDIAPGINVGSVVGLYEAGRNALCVKTTNGGYCLVEQIKVLKPVLEKLDPNNPQAGVLGVVSNKDFVCTDCFQKQVSALQNAELPATLKGQFDSITTTFKDICGNSYKTVVGEGDNKQKSSALTSAGSLISAAMGFFALLLN